MGYAAYCAGRRGVRRRAPFQLRLISAGLLLAALLGAAGACRSGRGGPPPYKKVKPAVAYEILRDSPETLVLDLRPAAEFNGPDGHLKSAYNIPEDQLARRLIEIGPFRDQTFVVYCDPDCGGAGMAMLVSSGFRDAIFIVGGFEAWVAAGFDTVLSVVPGDGKRAADSDMPLLPPPD